MAKQSGLGARFLVGGFDISGDVNALDQISGGPAMLDGTDITLSAHARIPTLRDGHMQFTVFMDTANAHPVLDALPRADVLMTALIPPLAVGSPSACLNAKQVDYNPTRSASGDLLFKVMGEGNSFGLEWGVTLTPGLRTDSVATNGTSLNNTVATNFGAQAYLQLTAFTGTSVDIQVQQSPDNVTFNTLLDFGAQAAAPATSRLATFQGSFTATNASPCVFTSVGHNYVANQPVVLSQLGTAALPGGFTAGTTYFVTAPSGNTFQLAATSGGVAINSSSTGSGFVRAVVQQYLRAITGTGTFSSATFAVVIDRNLTATAF